MLNKRGLRPPFCLLKTGAKSWTARISLGPERPAKMQSFSAGPRITPNGTHFKNILKGLKQLAGGLSVANTTGNVVLSLLPPIEAVNFCKSICFSFNR